MTNTESTQRTLLQYIVYAACAQSHFKMFSSPFCVSARHIPPCECGPHEVRRFFPFASDHVLNAAQYAVVYTSCLREYALAGDFMLFPVGAPPESIPFSFVHTILQAMLDDPNHPVYHHTGQIRGYCRRNGYAIESYNGRFGRGYRVHYPSAKASPGRHEVEYYINTKEAQS